MNRDGMAMTAALIASVALGAIAALTYEQVTGGDVPWQAGTAMAVPIGALNAAFWVYVRDRRAVRKPGSGKGSR
jgi:hypothetical protein